MTNDLPTINPRFFQIPGRNEWIITGMGEGVCYATKEDVDLIYDLSQSHGLWPYECIVAEKLKDHPTGYLMGFIKSGNTKRWGYSE